MHLLQMRVVLFIIYLRVAGALVCLAEVRDSVCSFALGEPCTFELTSSSCNVNVTMDDTSKQPRLWRWKTESNDAFKQREPGMGVTGSHFWYLTIDEIFEQAHQVVKIKCRYRNSSQGPISFVLSG